MLPVDSLAALSQWSSTGLPSDTQRFDVSAATLYDRLFRHSVFFCSHIPQMHFETILRMPKGKEALDYFKKKGELNEATRKGLISAVVEHYLAVNVTLKIEDFNYLAQQIIRRFPTESKVNGVRWLSRLRIIAILFQTGSILYCGKEKSSSEGFVDL